MFGLKKREAEISEPPYSYSLLKNLQKEDYPQYLKKIFKRMTGENLNLKQPKTFSEKIQWLKLYDCTPLKTRLTDKVLVRDWVKAKIGEAYLKPALQIVKTFDDINFDLLPNSFIMKANNGCKWHYIVKDKKQFLANRMLFEFIRDKLLGWLSSTFTFWAGFELQYEDIEPQIIIEPLMIEIDNINPVEIEVYCFNGQPKIVQKVKQSTPREVCVYDENMQHLDILFKDDYILTLEEADDNLRLAVSLSRVLAKDFKLVRVDWLLHKNHIYFNEMTFTPFSGFYRIDKDVNYKLGKLLKIK